MAPDYASPRDADSPVVSWEYESPRSVPSPLAFDAPYVEIKLEHTDIEATRFSESFFPSAVPYELDGEHRVYCWRRVLEHPERDPKEWDAICATTHEITGATNDDRIDPRLWTAGDDEIEVVVNGTIAGNSTTVGLQNYEVPTVTLVIQSDTIDCRVDGTTLDVERGSRITHRLPSQEVSVSDTDDEIRMIAPTLQVRFPGTRTLYHPALDGEYALFPSFGLDLDTLPESIAVPTTNGELAYGELATNLGVDLSDRPYPERVLWQAFAYSAFDPRRSQPPRLTQFPNDQIAVQNPQLTRHA